MVAEWQPHVDQVAASLLHRAEQSVRRTRGLLSESGATAALAAETQFDQDPEVASWQICAEAPLNMMDAQRVLSAESTTHRLELLIELTEAMELDLHRMLASG
jgi:Lon protease-like protein